MPAHLGQRRWRAEEIELEVVQQHTLGTQLFVLSRSRKLESVSVALSQAPPPESRESDA